MVPYIVLTSDTCCRTGSCHEHNHPDNELYDDRKIDEDEHHDYADDQEPLPFPTPTGVLGPLVQFL
jgi:hypothetical protein